jgi:hypothetical protein
MYIPSSICGQKATSLMWAGQPEAEAEVELGLGGQKAEPLQG